MNRPKKKDYPEVIKIINGVVTTYTSDKYEKDLEKYCDELEQENKKLKKSIDNVAGFLYVHGVRFDQDEKTD